MCSTQSFFIFGGHAVTNVHHWAQPQFQLKFSWNDHDTEGDPTKIISVIHLMHAHDPNYFLLRIQFVLFVIFKFLL